jgi:hypothetical protein
MEEAQKRPTAKGKRYALHRGHNLRIRSKWLRLTEETNALDYLEKAVRFIHETEENRLAWKWVVLALHGALYGFAICACQGTNYENVTIRNRRGELRLISFGKALERCQDPRFMRMLIGSQPLTLSDSQKESIRQLKNELRNKMEHYVPSGWSIEIHGMPQIAIDFLDIIRFLAVDTRTYIHLNKAQKKRIRTWVFQTKKFLRDTKLYQEVQNERNGCE